MTKAGRDVRFRAAPQAEAATVRALVERAGRSSSKHLEIGSTDRKKIVRFLCSPEVSRIVEQLFVLGLADDCKPAMLRNEFTQLAAVWIPEQDDDAVAEIFSFLIDLTHSLLGSAIEEGVLAAHEARSTYRFTVLLNELKAIQHTLSSGCFAIDLEAVLKFEQDLRKHVRTATAYLAPPYLDEVRRIPIDDLFVSPDLRFGSAGQDGVELTVEGFLSCSYRAVVLGDPGGGKSTLVQRICHDMASPPPASGGVTLTPMLVTLRDYGARRRVKPLSLKDYLYEVAHSRYQLDPPEHAFEYLLSQGRLLVLLDGLDELVVTSDRQRITEDVEHFCAEYTNLPIIVTSRRVGYDQAPLNPDIFERFALKEFSARQASEYAEKWFAVDPALTAAQRKSLSRSFLHECSSVPDLRSNALMLGLLCNIYRGENWIPRNRPEVYEKCALMLFDRWDRRRGIVAFETFRSHLRPALEYLAHWIFSDVARQGGVTEAELVRVATDYLHGKRFEGRVDAEDAAKAFIDFCRGRAWVFTDTGTSARGERLFQFTHRTFLEYFTAVHLSRTHSTPESLGDLLVPHVVRNEWDIVAQLAVQIQDRQVDGAGDDLLMRLIVSGGSDGERTAALGFAGRTLRFLVPKPATARRIANEAVSFALDDIDSNLTEDAGRNVDHGSFGVLAELVSCSPENREAVAAGVGDAVMLAFEGDSLEVRAQGAAEVALHLNVALRVHETRDDNASRYWYDFGSNVVERYRDVLREIGSYDFGIASDLVLERKLSILEYVEAHGVQALFTPRSYAVFRNVTRVPLAELYLGKVFGRLETSAAWTAKELEDDLEVIGRMLIEEGPVWSQRQMVEPWMRTWFVDDQVGRLQPLLADPRGYVFAGLFCLVATALGSPDGRASRGRQFIEMLPDIDTWRLLGGLIGSSRALDRAEAKRVGLDQPTRTFITRWLAPARNETKTAKSG